MVFVKREVQTLNNKDIEKDAEKYGISITALKLINSRGIKDVEKFLHPSIDDLNDPFLLSGMDKTIERLKQALNNNETIVIYGDYDVDGVSASAILYLYLSSLGLKNIYCFLPNRYEDGYGLTTGAIEKVVEKYMPDLIITVDCGISCKKEVDYIHDLGLDVIITDHHNIPEVLPDCVIVDPKLKNQEYPFKELCGTGVALKIVQAMGGIEKAKEYIDIAAIATVADIVPLIDENRAIVVLGLERMKTFKRKGIDLLMHNLKITGNLTSTDISFKIAPKMNAGGRMGDAKPALVLYISDNEQTLKKAVNQLISDNTKRKDLCAKIYDESEKQIAENKLYNSKAIILSSNEWDSGVLGIVCARLAQKYNRPIFLLSQIDDYLKGSVRSISGVDIYEALSDSSDLLENFGGHTMAGGLTLKVKNYDKFSAKITNYITKNCNNDLFMPTTIYDEDIDIKNINIDFVSNLDILEPFGCGNPHPLFKVEFGKTKVSLMHNFNNHLIVKNKNLSMVYFNGTKHYFLLNSECKKSALLELQTDIFRGRKSIKGVIRSLECAQSESFQESNDIAIAEYIKQLLYKNKLKNAKFEQYNKNKLKDLLNLLFGNSFYGNLIVANTYKSYENFKSLIDNNLKNKIVYNDIFNLSAESGFNTIILAPKMKNDFTAFKNIIFLDPVLDEGYISKLNETTDAKIYIPDNTKFDIKIFENIKTEHKEFAKYFNFINRKIKNDIVGINEYDWFCKARVGVNEKLNYIQFIVCLYVFCELGLLEINKEEGIYKINKASSEKTELQNSKLYNTLNLLKKII